MKKLALSLCILMAVWNGTALSQEAFQAENGSRRNTLSLFSGLTQHSIRDEMMSPLIYSGYQVPVELTYSFRGLQSRHSASLAYDQSRLKSAITTQSSHYVRNMNLNLEYAFACNIKDIEYYNTSCFLGFKFHCMLNLRNHYFLPGKNQMSAEQMTGLGIHVLSETSFSKGKNLNRLVSISVSVPLLTYAILSERYNANVSGKFEGLDYEKNIIWQLFKNGDIVSVDRYFAVQTDLSYNHQLTRALSLILKCKLMYYSFEQYKSLFHSRVLNSQFLVGFGVSI